MGIPLERYLFLIKANLIGKIVLQIYPKLIYKSSPAYRHP